jgi:hypothetical protein
MTPREPGLRRITHYSLAGGFLGAAVKREEGVDGKEGWEGKGGLGSGERLREEWDLFLDEKSWA